MKDGLYYLALPYKGTDQEIVYRIEVALQATTDFLLQGYSVFSPTLYVNRIAEALCLPSLDKRREIIMPYLFDFLKVSKGMIVIQIEGWREFWGVNEELKFCLKSQIPVYLATREMVENDLSQTFSESLSLDQLRDLIKV